ncbi:hypothetical protein [Vibrio cholerae]|uniref:hypothetical protein n=1 Tax=Vibrio cholerae TaxID=666 RepID=UPI0006E707AF|nr:hypothetical protein [Vibrio cholerae]MBY7899155.1 hypothetical protein [Vibrio fluvialis]KQA15677.1 hypothetical protein XM60_02960 [Vibrio cholerae]KQA84411.1 hypothetical protein XV86_04210 [Vibrio cholerae]KQA91980.1 hypothetical protein XV88_01595 [Vibrio cholerae]PAR75467.1 hypothetical protein CGT86_16190 [Vibrio cholerae]
MIYNEQLKEILTNVRNYIDSGDNAEALKYLEMAEMYANHHKFDDWRVAEAIQFIAKNLNISEPQAIEEVLYYGFFEAGRIVAGGGFSILSLMMQQRKLETIQTMMPYFGVKKMSAQEESAALSSINANKGVVHG